MSEFIVPADKGRNTAMDELRLQQGFLRVAEGWIYVPDDPDRPHKFPGTTSAKTLASPQTTTPYGLSHLQFDNDDNQILLLANSQLYETDASASLGSWTSVVNQSATAFARAGTFMKSIPSSRNEWIVWTGGASERPLIRDEDGNWRYLSMNKPNAPTLSSVLAASPTETRPDATAADGSNTQFSTLTNAYDNSQTTAATGTRSSAGSHGNVFSWTDAGNTTGYTLNIRLGTSSMPIEGDPPGGDSGGGGGQSGGAEALVARVTVEVSEDSGTNYTTILTQSVPVITTTVQAALTGGLWTALRVRVRLVYTSGTAQVILNLYEIWGSSNGGNAAIITDGTYKYAITEVYKRVLTSGKVIQAESAPSDVLSVSVSGSNKYGVVLTIPSSVNGLAEGLPAATVFKRIYRSTSSGAWPDLGFVGEIVGSATVFSDAFAVAGASLGTPSINTIDVVGTFINAAGQSPSIWDATLYKGSIVAISANDKKRLQWSLPGFPDYFPLPAHDLALLPTARNDDLRGVCTVGDTIVVFLRTRVVRVRELFFADRAGFDLGRMEIDIISPNAGLAGTPKSYCTFESQKGHSAVAWVADSGIWMTDGGLPSENGMGAVKLTPLMNWKSEVDTTRLEETVLSFDPVLQTLFFDYYDRNGAARTLTFAVSPNHWVPSGQDQNVPKHTGPHLLGRVADRTIGELGNTLRHWSLNTTDSAIYNERTGTDRAGDDILSVLETGWLYFGGPSGELHIFDASVYHSDWGASEALTLDLLARRDTTGEIQTYQVSGLPLRGARVSGDFVSRAGQSFKVRLTHIGKTTSTGTPLRAVGPIVLEGETMGDIERD